ncbi:DNA repair protein RadC [Romeria aff. gracilis LEGE 07310]|uniref:DNA repair protein RadC n=1 Tax=Vasconcelosia minhoensis LEGE 07310 TaxID=915328 RepID=A0A8J7DNN4_9CYAN|nr:DNA repair protein RadC [Romeria gracilis]MBE9080151.1 DNA repair protein RadC [Romeria aff. gracilis LEGE 07310]
MTYSLRMLDMPESERPRERLLAQGVKRLSAAELIAILINTGQGPGKLSAVGLGQHLLQELGKDQPNQDGLLALREVSVDELTKIPGIGPAKAATILAAIELGKRILQTQPPRLTVVDDPSIAAAALGHELMWQTQERFAVLLLDIKHRIIGTQVITIGTATETLAHPREIFREVIRRGATRVIVAHNHPSGNLDPSPEDLSLTRQLLQGATFLGIPLLDHLIIGNGDYASLRQTTSLWSECPQE